MGVEVLDSPSKPAKSAPSHARRRSAAPLEELISLSALLTSTRDLDAVIQQALRAALSLSRHDQGSIMMTNRRGRGLVIRAVVGQDSSLVGTSVPSTEHGIAGWVLRSRRPLYFEGPAQPPPGLKIQYTKDLPSSICLPLLTPPGRAIGVLSLNAVHRAARLTPEDIDVLQAMANHVAIGIDNARLYQSLQQKERQLERTAAELVRAQEEERRRVAYEIHDGLAQVLVGAFQRLQTYRDRRPPRSPEAKAELLEVEQQLKGCIEEVRRVIADLRPTVLDDFGLEQALERHLTLAGRESGWKLEFQADLKGKSLPAPVETTAYRIVQEAVTNARKHASSLRLSVMVRRGRGKLVLRVRDWGVGLPAAERRQGGLGLGSMAERAAALGGELTLKSRPGRGTVVEAWLPVREA